MHARPRGPRIREAVASADEIRRREYDLGIPHGPCRQGGRQSPRQAGRAGRFGKSQRRGRAAATRRAEPAFGKCACSFAPRARLAPIQGMAEICEFARRGAMVSVPASGSRRTGGAGRGAASRTLRPEGSNTLQSGAAAARPYEATIGETVLKNRTALRKLQSSPPPTSSSAHPPASTLLFNRSGSVTVADMGGFGPNRRLPPTPLTTALPLSDSRQAGSILDVTDLVFIDRGTAFRLCCTRPRRRIVRSYGHPRPWPRASAAVSDNAVEQPQISRSRARAALRSRRSPPVERTYTTSPSRHPADLDHPGLWTASGSAGQRILS